MSGIAEVMHAVATATTDDFQLRHVPAEELRTVYQRRRARLMDAHPTSDAVDRLLKALASYTHADVSVVTLEGSGRVVSIWLSEPPDSVLATLVADDKRQ